MKVLLYIGLAIVAIALAGFISVIVVLARAFTKSFTAEEYDG